MNDIHAGDRVTHRESGKRGEVAELLTVGAAFLDGGEPIDIPTAWVKWDDEKQREAVPLRDLARQP